jgi:hypothetical protein
MYSLLTQKGVPVLAYLFDCPLPCSFKLKYSEDLMQATISLRFSISVDGFDDNQNFTLIYNADNLVADRTTLCHNVDTAISTEQQLSISRQGQPLLKTLSLALKDPCSVQCSPRCANKAPHKSTCPTYHCFVQLARATEVKIIIDYNQYRVPKQDVLNRIIGSLGQFTACSFTDTRDQVQQTVRAAFGHAASENLAASHDLPVSENPPPPYIDVSNAHPTQGATKRLRHGEFFQHEPTL